jgi:hypothetical protein
LGAIRSEQAAIDAILSAFPPFKVASDQLLIGGHIIGGSEHVALVQRDS